MGRRKEVRPQPQQFRCRLDSKARKDLLYEFSAAHVDDVAERIEQLADRTRIKISMPNPTQMAYSIKEMADAFSTIERIANAIKRDAYGGIYGLGLDEYSEYSNRHAAILNELAKFYEDEINPQGGVRASPIARFREEITSIYKEYIKGKTLLDAHDFADSVVKHFQPIFDQAKP